MPRHVQEGRELTIRENKPEICGIHECRDRARWRVQYWRCPNAPSPLAYQMSICGLHRKRWPGNGTLLIGVVAPIRVH